MCSSDLHRNPECNAAIARFLKEFRATPHRSEQARSCVDGLCSRVITWFAAASAENLVPWNGHDYADVARYGGSGFVRAASFVGHLIEFGVLDLDLVRRHLVKPLIAHHYTNPDDSGRGFRTLAIYQLFLAAGNTLLQGLLEPKDIEACFETFDTKMPSGFTGLNAVKLNV